MNGELPACLTMRQPTFEDLEIVHQLGLAHDLEYLGEEEFTLDEMRTLWSAPTYHLEDTRLVFDLEGRLVAYLSLNLRNRIKFGMHVTLLPGYKDAGLGDYLLGLAESIARERLAQTMPGARIILSSWVPATDQGAVQRLQRAGFQDIRHFFRMERVTLEAPAEPIWPEGVELLPFVPGRDDRAIF